MGFLGGVFAVPAICKDEQILDEDIVDLMSPDAEKELQSIRKFGHGTNVACSGTIHVACSG